MERQMERHRPNAATDATLSLAEVRGVSWYRPIRTEAKPPSMAWILAVAVAGPPSRCVMIFAQVLYAGLPITSSEIVPIMPWAIIRSVQPVSVFWTVSSVPGGTLYACGPHASCSFSSPLLSPRISSGYMPAHPLPATLPACSSP